MKLSEVEGSLEEKRMVQRKTGRLAAGFLGVLRNSHETYLHPFPHVSLQRYRAICTNTLMKQSQPDRTTDAYPVIDETSTHRGLT
jgi:hypothetical protein